MLVLPRRVVALTSLLAVATTIASAACTDTTSQEPDSVVAEQATKTISKWNPGDGRPLALVYRGDDEAGCEGCSEAVEHLLVTSKLNFIVEFVGPHEKNEVDDETLERAVLYAQPAGGGTVDDAWKTVAKTAPAVRRFVKNGGRYLGFCMGGYFAGSNPGFELLPGDTDQWIASKKASVKTEDDAIVSVDWRREKRSMYFQDGPFFIVDKGAKRAKEVEILATYSSNEKIAALVAPYGKGRVGVSGPHPEADASWYALAKLTDPDGIDADLGYDLIEATMR